MWYFLVFITFYYRKHILTSYPHKRSLFTINYGEQCFLQQEVLQLLGAVFRDLVDPIKAFSQVKCNPKTLSLTSCVIELY